MIYHPLAEAAMCTIVEMTLGQVSQRLLTHMAAKQKPQSLTLGWDEEERIGLAFDMHSGSVIEGE